MPVVKKCLCGCELQTGALILGWLAAIGSFIYFLIAVSALSNIETFIDEISKDELREKEIDVQTIRMGMRIYFTSCASIQAINLLSAVLLIIGAIKKMHKMLIPWLIINIGSIFVLGIITLIVFIVSIYTSVPEGFVITFILGIIIGIEGYFWICIYSLYQQIKKGNKDCYSNTGTLLQPPSYGQLHKPALPPYTPIA